MTLERSSRPSRTIPFMIMACLLALPAYAKYSGGTGEPNDPYQIATAADLIALGETPADYDKHFILTADIDLDPKLPGRRVFDKAVIAPHTDPTKEYFQGTPFAGVFDADGHTISHLTINGDRWLGLFGQMGSTASASNLGLAEVEISGTGWYVGGLVGENWGSIATSYSTGTISGTDGVGGLIGQLNHGSVTYCYSTATVAGRGSVGGLVGQSGFDDGGSGAPDVTPLPSTIVTRCYSAGVVSGSQNVGGLLGLVVFGDVSRSFWDIQTSGQAVSAAGTGKTTAEMKDPKTFQAAGWDFVGQADGPHDIWTEPAGTGYPILWWQWLPLVDLPRFSEGLGEPNDPYMISTVDELCRIGHNPRLMRCHFRLANDLDLLGSHFYPIGGPAFPYTATFNGNGHTISHLTITGESHLGLFGQLGWGAQVRDLGVVDVNLMSSAYYVGGLAGKNAGGSVVNCYSSGVLGDTGEWSQCVGGLVGYNSGNISASHSDDAVTGTMSVGGLVGFNSGTIATSYSRGLVCGGGYAYVGGLVGSNRGAIATSCSRASVSSTGAVVVGGLVGENGGSIAASYSRGSVNGSRQLGGLVGYNWGGKIAASYSSGAVSGIYLVGGLVGPNSGSIAASFWDTQTSGQATSAGGTGKTTDEMQTASTFLDAGWDFVGETANGTEDIWWILEGKDYPRLWWEEGDETSP